MSLSTKLDEKLEGADNFRAWKYRVMLILEEHDLEGFIENEVPEPEGDEAKARHKKSLIKAKRIIADSIKDHLIPHVSSLKTLKEMFDALSRLYEGKNINRKMTLRAQLMGVKMQDLESIQSYFTRVSQLREQIEAIGDWRFSQRSKTSDDDNECFSKTMGPIHQRHLLSKEDYKVQQTMGRLRTRRRNIGSP